MRPRPLDFLDLPTLYHYRAEAVSLDSTRYLTRGNPLGAAGFLSYFNPSRHLYTAISQENGSHLLGGVLQNNQDSFARLIYLAPRENLRHEGLPTLVEHLCAEAGSWGAFHVIAETEDGSDVFPTLRMAGFSVYAWQRIWDVGHINSSGSVQEWVTTRSINLPAVQSLYHQIVPTLIQPVEVAPRYPIGMVTADSSRCYVKINYGLYGIVLTPIIHPETVGVAEKLASLLHHLPDRRGRPVYMCVRSYQAWLEPVIEELGGISAPRQAVMVKHLTRVIKEEQTVRAAQPAGVSVQPSHVTQNKP